MQNRIVYAAMIFCLVGCDASSDYDVWDDHEAGGAAPNSHAGGAASARTSYRPTAPSSSGGASSVFTSGTLSSGGHSSTLLSGSGGSTKGLQSAGGSIGTIQWTGGGGGCTTTTTSPTDAGAGNGSDDLWGTEGAVFPSTPQEYPCMFDEHCPTGYVCTTQGVVSELADEGIGHCTETTANEPEAPGAEPAQ